MLYGGEAGERKGWKRCVLRTNSKTNLGSLGRCPRGGVPPVNLKGYRKIRQIQKEIPERGKHKRNHDVTQGQFLENEFRKAWQGGVHTAVKGGGKQGTDYEV